MGVGGGGDELLTVSVWQCSASSKEPSDWGRQGRQLCGQSIQSPHEIVPPPTSLSHACSWVQPAPQQSAQPLKGQRQPIVNEAPKYMYYKVWGVLSSKCVCVCVCVCLLVYVCVCVHVTF